MEKVTDVLDHKNPHHNTVNYNCLVSDALFQMSGANIEHLVVLNDDKFVGIITEHDIATKVLFDNRPLNKVTVKEYVNRTIPIASAEDNIDFCMQLMDRYHVKHVAIFDNFTFKGVLAYQDLVDQALHMHHVNY